MLPIYHTKEDAIREQNSIPSSTALIPGWSIWLCPPDGVRQMRVTKDEYGDLYGESKHWMETLRAEDSGWFATSYVSKSSLRNLRFYIYEKKENQQ